MRFVDALLLGAVLLAALPATAVVAAEKPYVFGRESELDYYLVHPMHHVKGVSHALEGKVALDADHLVLPLALKLPLLTFNSGNGNRDSNAAYTLDVPHFPVATLEVTKFAESSRVTDAGGLRLSGTATGRLALHGLTHAVSIPLQALVTASKLVVDGEFVVKLTDYGITRPSLLFKPVDDDVRVTVHGVATR
jgi:polyisoprenoid-binding protein YceI